MEKYLVPLKPARENPKPNLKRHNNQPWKRSLVELNGKLEPKYRHDLSYLLVESYAQMKTFPHSYHIDGDPCLTHIGRINEDVNFSWQKRGVSALEFDNKGIYLASVTKSGCLTVHDFENLFCWSNDSSAYMHEDESNQLLHLEMRQQLDSVLWNPTNQNEVLKTKFTFSFNGIDSNNGLSEVAFTTDDKSRVIATDTHGILNIWDRRVGAFPCLEFTTESCSVLNSVQLHVENQIAFAAGKHGIVYMWDLRGGKSSEVYQTYKKACHPPLSSLKISALLDKIAPLKAQSGIFPKEIHSIRLNPSCPYQLGFHLDDGWSGVLDLNSFRVTHIHCPPPAWLNGSSTSTNLSCLRKPSWLPTHSIYAVGSSTEDGIHFLDFYPDNSSPSHVDYKEDVSGSDKRRKQNRFVPLSEGVTACAAHPLNGTIVAGTKHSSLLVVSHKRSQSETG
ncbi:hypothetical protein ACFE04_028933 [Oxalis oulophora]